MLQEKMPINMKLLMKISEHKVGKVTISNSSRAFCRVSDYLYVYRYFEKDLVQEKMLMSTKMPSMMTNLILLRSRRRSYNALHIIASISNQAKESIRIMTCEE